MAEFDADRARAEMLDSWERAAPRWGRQAERVLEMGMAVSAWMIDQLRLQPGHRVLELAAGPGDTGFLAAELIRPGGTLICSDGAEAMLEVARARAAARGLENVEFMPLQLEWIDLPAADVDAILCRWGLMFAFDPAAALRECRRILRPGGRIAVAVWAPAEENPWATIPRRALIELGLLEDYDAGLPGMFSLGAPGVLAERLAAAGFAEVAVQGIDLPRRYTSVEAFLGETVELSEVVASRWKDMDESQRAQVAERVAELAEPYRQADGALRLPGCSLGASAEA